MNPLHLPPALADTLDLVSQVTASAIRPWWIVGSAAMALHGLRLHVADVDLMLAPDDATRVLQENGRLLPPDGGGGQFRSDVFGRVERGTLIIDVLGGFHIRKEGRWVALQPTTRVAVGLRGGTVFIPSKLELAAITRSLGRPKDALRAQMLEA